MQCFIAPNGGGGGGGGGGKCLPAELGLRLCATNLRAVNAIAIATIAMIATGRREVVRFGPNICSSKDGILSTFKVTLTERTLLSPLPSMTSK